MLYNQLEMAIFDEKWPKIVIFEVRVAPVKIDQKWKKKFFGLFGPKWTLFQVGSITFPKKCFFDPGYYIPFDLAGFVPE